MKMQKIEKLIELLCKYGANVIESRTEREGSRFGFHDVNRTTLKWHNRIVQVYESLENGPVIEVAESASENFKSIHSITGKLSDDGDGDYYDFLGREILCLQKKFTEA